MPILIPLVLLTLASAPPLLRLLVDLFVPEIAQARLAVAAVVLGLGAWSTRSAGRRREPDQTAPLSGKVWGACAAALAITGGATIADRPLLAGLVVPVLVWLAATVLDLSNRERPLSPFWLAVASLYLLPVKEAVQAHAGGLLVDLAADGACRLLRVATSEGGCDGPVMTFRTAVVAVVPACSGAGALAVQTMVVAFLAAILRPRPDRAATMLVIATAAALFANAVRIAVLTVAADQGAIDLFASPWHGLTGTAALALGALPALAWAAATNPRPLGPPEPASHRG